MLRHKGKRRTYYHNLQLASILSFVAGIVNVTSVLALSVLTTNVTGHFAYFAEQLVNNKLNLAFLFLAYSLCFLSGAFVSSFMAEIFARRNPRMSYAAPLTLEMLAIGAVVFFVRLDTAYSVELSAGILLFAMGVQNAMVTKISKSVVRTTHLTGLFTDLGIELSQLFFYKSSKRSRSLVRNIKLKFTIVVSFFVGGILGGYGYRLWGLDILGLAIGVVFLTLIHDYVRYQYYYIKRRVKYRH